MLKRAVRAALLAAACLALSGCTVPWLVACSLQGESPIGYVDIDPEMDDAVWMARMKQRLEEKNAAYVKYQAYADYQERFCQAAERPAVCSEPSPPRLGNDYPVSIDYYNTQAGIMVIEGSESRPGQLVITRDGSSELKVDGRNAYAFVSMCGPSYWPATHWFIEEAQEEFKQ